MSDTQVDVKETQETEGTTLREYTEAELTRTFTISEEAYAKLMEVVEEADSRGLNSSAQYWLESLMKKHGKVQMDLWRKADDTSILNQAKKGSRSAQLAMLATLGIKGDAAIAALKSLGK